ncbi:right-handed parallel beta-helix repeat-containing protein, partial [bacterium]|nr:right-handed parallel beta-helix repeat-containing protein [bacterium]
EVSGGGISCELSSPEITYCTINYNNTNQVGGGISCVWNPSPIITDCEIKGNSSDEWAGGIYCQESSPYIADCTISNNKAKISGGGILCKLNSSPIITGCKIKINDAEYGGGIYCQESSTQITDCEINKNFVTLSGGGIYCSLNSSALLLNCILMGNSANEYAGGICINKSLVKMINCNVVENKSNTMGSIVTLGSDGRTTLLNSIIWNNTLKDIYGNTKITFSLIEGGYEGMGNINVDPMFVTGPRGDYYLSQIESSQEENSPCFNAGRELPFEGYAPQWLTTRTDGLFDTDRTDIGCHYNPHIMFDLSIDPSKDEFTSGDNMKLLLDVETASVPQIGDIYFVMLNPDNRLYFGMGWSTDAKPGVSEFTFPADLFIKDITLLNMTIPNTLPLIENKKTYTFAIAVTNTNSMNFKSNLPTVSFEVK